MTLVNFMPLDRSHPVALELLRSNLEEAARRAAAEDVRLLVPASAADVIAALPEGSFVTADDSFGFVYANDTAAARVLVGEKPLPSAVSGTTEGCDPLVSGESWLCGDERKVVYVGDARVESAAQTTVGELLGAAGVSADGVKAVYLGYPMSTFVAPAHFGDGATLSCDDVRVIGSGDCAVDAVREILDGFHRECCGRCVFGNEGGHQLCAILADACGGKGQSADLDLIRDLAPTMAEQALCEVGQRMAGVAAQALVLFGDEFEAHVSRHQCPAGTCRALVTYHILVSRCTGCGECLDACEDDAIEGKTGFVHVIDQRACVHCGKCLDACPKGAVVTAGPKKPKTPPHPIPCRVH
jgi:NAD-dependent dihydropyrimidine dehydrogenase PreA subunit